MKTKKTTKQTTESFAGKAVFPIGIISEMLNVHRRTLRIYDDENGIMNKSILDSRGSILSVSQFTLYGDAKKGRRPSYANALSGEKATLLYDEFNNKLKKHIHVETGIFGAEMKVELINDGPVTIMLEK